jgi:hypothetical protein
MCGDTWIVSKVTERYNTSIGIQRPRMGIMGSSLSRDTDLCYSVSVQVIRRANLLVKEPYRIPFVNKISKPGKQDALDCVCLSCHTKVINFYVFCVSD